MVHAWIPADTTSAARRHERDATRGIPACPAKPDHRSMNWKAARALFVLTAFLILFSGLTLMRTFASSGERAPASGEEIVVTVESGDTLWELARAYKDPALDTRQAVHVLMERNGLSGPDLRSGQDLIFPADLLP
ncbi:LysM peptidoglycan-binding domain-containing protein [Cohnella hongkongensis]|uniref:LysM peptidoglycan-binding domain-containing protein n=1 Tax=Cohnella hongkongensis TaxID=178337 RepID=A0ABV9FA83_9BACL